MAVVTEAPPVSCPSCGRNTKITLGPWVTAYTDPHYCCRGCGYSGTLHWTNTHGTWAARNAKKKANAN